MPRRVLLERFLLRSLGEPKAGRGSPVRFDAAKGVVLGAHDLWIAATALTHGLDLATDDGAAFGRVPGLTVLASP